MHDREGRRSGSALLKGVAHRAGFEPTTPRFVVWCSIQLSYRCLRPRLRVRVEGGDAARRTSNACRPEVQGLLWRSTPKISPPAARELTLLIRNLDIEPKTAPRKGCSPKSTGSGAGQSPCHVPEVTYRPCRRHHLSDGNAEARYCSHRPSDELNQRSCVSGLPLQKRPHEHCHQRSPNQRRTPPPGPGKARGGAVYSAPTQHRSALPMLGNVPERAAPFVIGICAAETDVPQATLVKCQKSLALAIDPAGKRQPRQKLRNRGEPQRAHWPAASSRCAPCCARHLNSVSYVQRGADHPVVVN